MKSGNESKEFTIAQEGISLGSEKLIAVIRLVLGKNLPFRFRVKGYSMLPFIRNEDIVTISPLTKRKISLGLPVAFVHPENKNLIIHRVVSCSKGGYLIKGDNVFHPDGRIPRENILGVITRVERKKRKVLFCLGPERVLIAVVSRYISLIPRLFFIYNRLHPAKRRAIYDRGVRF